MLEISRWETRIHFPPLSDLSEHSFGISGLNRTRISVLVGPGGNRVTSSALHYWLINSLLALCHAPFHFGIVSVCGLLNVNTRVKITRLILTTPLHRNWYFLLLPRLREGLKKIKKGGEGGGSAGFNYYFFYFCS